jgi:diguanylate cyclase (GGDEF)-like protein
MIAKTRDWVVRQLTLGHFSTRTDVVYRSAVLAVKVGIAALCVNLAMEATMAWLGLLPYKFSEAVKMIFIMSPSVAFLVGFVAYMVVGFAIYDLSRERGEFERLSRTDQLSGLSNRRAFLDTFEIADRKEKALLVFDIDHFKAINDRFGHSAGDLVIVSVAEVLSSVFTLHARAARIGGEEFAVLLCDRSLAEAMALAEIARMRVEALRLPHEDETITLTMSCGVTTLLPEEGFTSAFSRADRALYKAKHGGRNSVVPAPVAGSAPAAVAPEPPERRQHRGIAG